MASICEKCGAVGESVKLKPGSAAVQVGLLAGWALFLALGNIVAQQLIYLSWLCGIAWLAYGIWRMARTSDVCPSCKTTKSMISLDSPGGKKLQKQFASDS